MARIKITCPDCKKIITVDVKTIDKLRAENNALKQELSELRTINRLKDIFGGNT